MNHTLLTDLYQLTMAYALWKEGLADRTSVFHLFFRRAPFEGGYALAAGLAAALDHLEAFRFEKQDLDYLAGLSGADQEPLFEDAFLSHLGRLRFSCEVDAVAEGTVVYPMEPLLRVRGPVLEAQIVETPLLNAINFQTLVATKATRMVRAAGGDPVLEFGLRRAQGPDGGLSASRAAYLGGCAATSNLLAGKLYGIPVRGTHAHSWVLCFENEIDAFRAYAEALPANCVFLVDTYATESGLHHAIEVGHWLRSQGRELLGIRLDSGDLAELSQLARRMLDAAGFAETSIVASGDLDEERIAALRARGAPIGIWGVGTRLATAWGEPALGGVYKLSAIEAGSGETRRVLKLSDDAEKSSPPGVLQVRRYAERGRFVRDVIFDTLEGEPELEAESFEDLLVPVFRKGRRARPDPSLAESRALAAAQLERFDDPAHHAVTFDPRVKSLTAELSARRRP